MSHLEAIINKIIELELQLPKYDYEANKFLTIHIEEQDFDGYKKFYPLAKHHDTLKEACVYIINKEKERKSQLEI